MAQKISEILSAPAAKFVVDQTVTDVALQAGSSGILTRVDGQELFGKVDNVTIYALGIALPYQFAKGAGLFSCSLSWQKEDGTGTSEVYNGYLPACGVIEFPQGLYLANPGSSLTLRYRLVITVAGNVSMVYCPAAFTNASEVAVDVWANVTHLLPMETP